MTARRVELDYLIAPRRPMWPGALVFALALGCGVYLLGEYRAAQVELERLETVAALAKPQKRAAVPRERLDDEVKHAEAVVRSLALPWADLIRSVEQAAMRDVALLQLEPNPDTRVVKLTAEAKNRTAMFEYLRRLDASGGLAEVHLVGHQVRRDNPQRPLQFSVQAAMRAGK